MHKGCLHTLALPGAAQRIEELPQVVTLGGDELQRAVYVDGGPLGDLPAGGAQDGIGNFPLGQGGGICAAPDKGVLRLYLPVGHPIDAGLHIGARCLKGCFTGHIADTLAVYLDPQHKGLGERCAQVDGQRCAGQHGQQIICQLPRGAERRLEICRRPHHRPQQHGQQRKRGPRSPLCCRPHPAREAHGGIFDLKADKIQKITEGQNRKPRFQIVRRGEGAFAGCR